MIQPEVIRNVQPHYIKGSQLYFSKGNTVYTGELPALEHAGKEGSFDSGFLKNILAGIDLTKRIARLGFHKVKPFKDGLIAIQRGQIVFKEKGSDQFKSVFSEFRGSRPLDLFVHPGTEKVYFGEYFGNDDREEVYIYSSSDLENWDKAWTFKKGKIRHVHGMTWDEFRRGIWVYTGDSDDESGIWFTDDNFKTLEKIAGGSQKTRAVEIIPASDGLIIPMDSPFEQNYIYKYEINNKKFKNLSTLPGSAFHACISNGIYLISTVTEPSEVNKVNYASVYASLDGESWKELYRFEKDIFPVKFQFVTRYAEILFPSGENNTDYIVAFAQAIRKYGGNMVIWKKKDITDYLSK